MTQHDNSSAPEAVTAGLRASLGESKGGQRLRAKAVKHAHDHDTARAKAEGHMKF